MTKAERYLASVRALPCVLCTHLGLGCSLSSAHHIREDQGMSKRASDYLTVSLCYGHHQGPNGFHGLGRRAFERMYNLTELDLLGMTIEGMFA
ncbi:MAG: Ref family recombination enhancement nuclease [Pyrinomonadaceae bacterium]